jgi:hypothetical protein
MNEFKDSQQMEYPDLISEDCGHKCHLLTLRFVQSESMRSQGEWGEAADSNEGRK